MDSFSELGPIGSSKLPGQAKAFATRANVGAMHGISAGSHGTLSPSMRTELDMRNTALPGAAKGGRPNEPLSLMPANPGPVEGGYRAGLVNARAVSSR